MDESVLVILVVVVGAALLVLGSRIRSRSVRRPRRPEDPPRDESP